MDTSTCLLGVFLAPCCALPVLAMSHRTKYASMTRSGSLDGDDRDCLKGWRCISSSKISHTIAE